VSQVSAWRCDRCDVRALPDEGDGNKLPRAWGAISMVRGSPYLSTVLDLCTDCFAAVYSLARTPIAKATP